MFTFAFISSREDNLKGGIRTITKKAMHMLNGQRQVSIQEAIHMLDDKELVICSDKIVYVSLAQGQALRSETDRTKQKDIISVYRNRHEDHYHLSLEQFFYQVFITCTFKTQSNNNTSNCDQHRILMPKGMNCKARYPVDYDYAKGMLIMHKPWNKNDTLDKLFKNKERTINEFLRMIDNKEVPTSVQAQLYTAQKYSVVPRGEVLVKDGVNHPDIDEKQNDIEINERMVAWIHGSHLSDNKLLNDTLNKTKVYLGQDKDWSISDYLEKRETFINGEEYLSEITKLYYDSNDSTNHENILKIPTTKDGKQYSIESMEMNQKMVVLAAVMTVVRFLRNDKHYIPLRATIMGCGGTGKSYIINTILTMVRQMTKSNSTVIVGAPSGSAAFNVQGSTLHHLLGIGVTRPEDNITKKIQDKLQKQLKSTLCLIIDERSMLSSKVFGAAERNIRTAVYNGQNSQEVWGGVPVVLLFGDDYQLWPVIEEGAIRGNYKMTTPGEFTPTNKETAAQLITKWGTYLLTQVMTETVFYLSKNYRVKSKDFRKLLGRLRVGEATEKDAERIVNLHLTYYEQDETFMTNLKQNCKTMWLYARNEDKDNTNLDMLIQTSKNNKMPVARLACHYETNRTPTAEHQQPTVWVSHFDKRAFDTETNICVGARVALSNVNILPEIGLYNGAMGTVIEIVYKHKPVGPNDKEHYHLPDYVVVDFPNLKLPPDIPPWDTNHKTVSLITFILL